MPVIYTGFACTPNFTDNVSVLGKAVKITSTLRGCKLTLIKTVMNTGKTFTVWQVLKRKWLKCLLDNFPNKLNSIFSTVSPCDRTSYNTAMVKKRSDGKSSRNHEAKSLQFSVNQAKERSSQDRDVADKQMGQKMMRSMIEIPISGNQRSAKTKTTVKKTYIFGSKDNKAAWSKSSPNIHEETLQNKPMPVKQKQNNSCSDLLDGDPEIPEPDYSPILFRKAKTSQNSLWDNAARYKGSLENLVDTKESQTLKKVIEGRPRVKDMVVKLKMEAERDKMRQEMRQRFRDSADNSRNSSSRSSEEKSLEEGLNDADEIYRDLLGVVEEEKRHFLGEDAGSKINKKHNRIDRGYGSSEEELFQRRSRSSKSREKSLNQEINRNPDPNAERFWPRSSRDWHTEGPEKLNPYREVASRQSQFFNSLFPSRANRFGFPVYPQRHFGLPSPEGSGPVSFAGFTPNLNPSFYEPSMDAQEITTGSSSLSDSNPPTSLLSAVPKLLKPRTKKKKKRSFFSFFY